MLVTVSAGPQASRPLIAGWPAGSAILHQKGRRHSWAGIGPLSIKAFFGGRVFYESAGARYAVDDSRYLILNHGQPYAVGVDAGAPLESFCVFFEPGLVADVARSRTLSPESLLDRPQSEDVALPRFFERTYPHDRVVSPALLRLRRIVAERDADPQALVEPLHALADRLLAAQQRVRQEALRVRALRVSTREELYRRLHRAHDFIASCYDQPLGLAEIARVACLSPSHLLRSYRALFGCTPHESLTRRRLDEARTLLRGRRLSVTEVCLAVGFSSPTSFSALFRRHTGAAPDAWRRLA